MKHSLLLILALSGCTAFLPSEQVARQECTKYGYTPGTPAFIGCVERTANNISSMRSAHSNSYTPPPNMFMAPAQPVYQQRRHECVYRQIGNRIDCTSY